MRVPLNSILRIRGLLVLGASIFFLFAATIATLFQHWEMTHETWGYWFFARVLGETGTFVIPDRSPFYILYLQLFRWIGYPRMVTVEYVVTSMVFLSVFVLFLRPYLGLPVATLTAILWSPYMQISEPSVQKLSLAFGLAAVVLRRAHKERFYKACTYALLIFAQLTRASFFPILLLFIVWDGISYVRRQTVKESFSFRPKVQTDWPLGIVFGFSILVLLVQSPHRWNNVWFSTATWFPGGGKSFMNMLQNYNISYIATRYGTYVDHDFYFTNKEAFDGATNPITAYRANPAFISYVTREYLKVGIPMVTNMTQVPTLVGLAVYNFPAHFFFLLVMLLAAFFATHDTSTRIFVVGTSLAMVLVMVFYPRERSFAPVIPLFPLAVAVLLRFIAPFLRGGIKCLALPIVGILGVILFSGGPTATNFSGVFDASWNSLLTTIEKDRQANNLKFLEFRDTSIYFAPMKGSYEKIVTIANECRGIMTLEYTFLAAFTDIPIYKIYDIWEIPPFGDWGKSEYTGLTPDRIDCLFISKNLKYGVGAGTNSQLRYEHYIKPYEDYFKSQGATVYPIEGYGEAFIL